MILKQINKSEKNLEIHRIGDIAQDILGLVSKEVYLTPSYPERFVTQPGKIQLCDSPHRIGVHHTNSCIVSFYPLHLGLDLS